MGANTAIEWTDHTFNPWIGCTRVSPGCDHCYAEHQTPTRVFKVKWGGERHPKSDKAWKEPLSWNRRALHTGIRRRVFCASLSDVFDNQVQEEWRIRLWSVIRETEALDWMLLTKRPQNIRKMLPADWGDGWRHVWLGTTVENNEEAERRVPVLRRVPAALRFLSCEPLLELVDPDLSGISWVICGGESRERKNLRGRFMDPDWARALRDQCAASGASFFMKQMADKRPIPDDLLVRQWPASPASTARQAPAPAVETSGRLPLL